MIFQKCFGLSYEGTIRGDTSRFHSFISHLVEYIEAVKTLKAYLPNPLRSKVMVL